MQNFLKDVNIVSAVMDHIAEGIVVADAEGKVLYVNESLQTLLGYEEAELAGKKLSELIPSLTDICRSSLERQMEGMVIKHQEMPAIHKAGGEIAVDAGLSVLKSKDKVLFVVVVRDAALRPQGEEELYQKAMHDPLTGLANRTNFKAHLNEAIKLSKRYAERNFAILYMDLNKFKQVNDTLGHQMGDALLKEVAVRLSASIREGDLLARVGGDEFLLIAHKVSAEDCVRVAQRIVDKLDEPFNIHGKKISIGVSIGISLFPGDTKNGTTLLHYADMAMYMSKKEKHSAYRFFGEELLQKKKG